MRGGRSSFQKFPKIASWNLNRASNFSCLCLLPNCRNFKHFKHSDLRHQILKPYRHLKLSPPPHHEIKVTLTLGTGHKVSEREHIFWKSIFFILPPPATSTPKFVMPPSWPFLYPLFSATAAPVFLMPPLWNFLLLKTPPLLPTHILYDQSLNLPPGEVLGPMNGSTAKRNSELSMGFWYPVVYYCNLFFQ